MEFIELIKYIYLLLSQITTAAEEHNWEQAEAEEEEDETVLPVVGVGCATLDAPITKSEEEANNTETELNKDVGRQQNPEGSVIQVPAAWEEVEQRHKQ